MYFISSKTLFKFLFAISIFLLVFNPIIGKSDHVLTTRSSVVDASYALYTDCSSIASQDNSLKWENRASNCIYDQGNFGKEPLPFVYLGEDDTVPSSILSQYPGAKANWLPYWKTQMVGLSEGQFKSFVVPSNQHSYSEFAGKDLYYEIQILKIYNPELAFHLESSTITTSKTTPVVGEDNTLLIGGVLVAFVGSGGLFAYFRLGRVSTVKTEEIISKSKARESEKIQSLKNVISEREITQGSQNKPKLTRSKKPKSRRRR